MSSSEPGREPSMDEILASIRKIISEEPASADPSAASTGVAAATGAAGYDVPTEPILPTLEASGRGAAQNATPNDASDPRPFGGRLADALQTAVPKAQGSAGFDDDLADLLDEPSATHATPDASAAGAEEVPKSGPSADAQVPAEKPSFGRTFDPPAGLRPQRERPPETEDQPATAQGARLADKLGHPATDDGVTPHRNPAFGAAATLGAPSAGHGNTAPRRNDELAKTVPAAENADEPTKDTGPVVIAAMPKSSHSPTEPSAPAATTDAGARPIGFALRAVAGTDAPSQTPDASAIPSKLGDTPFKATQAREDGLTSRAGSSEAAGKPGRAPDQRTEPAAHALPSLGSAIAALNGVGNLSEKPPGTADVTKAADGQAAKPPASVTPACDASEKATPANPEANSLAAVAASSELSHKSGAPDHAQPIKAETPVVVSQPPAPVSTLALSETPAHASLAVRTLEDTVADLLRPMLRAWLDENMPRMVENALRIEMADSVRKTLDAKAVSANPVNAGAVDQTPVDPAGKKPN